MSKLIHKNCGGEIVVNLGDMGQPEEGYCLKCGEMIICSEQLQPTEVEEKDHDEESKNARDAYSGVREEE